MPSFKYGAYAFTFSGAFSGNAPTQVQGPNRQMYVIEHQIPAREGGIVEYQGSEQSRYQLKGFIAPNQDGGTTAALVLSGKAYVAVNSDDAKDFIKAMRGSGIQLLKIESTYSNMSGYQTLYENGFFQIEKMTLAFEAGRTYPYYPYSVDFKGSTPSTYGNGSGVTGFDGAGFTFAGGVYYSGLIYAWQVASTSGTGTKGEVINTLGLYVINVASGAAKVALYSGNLFSGGTNGLIVQSAPQVVHSGWNYFPIRPSFLSNSGVNLIFAFAGTATNSSGFIVGMSDFGGAIFTSDFMSGIGFDTAFPTVFSGHNSQISGQNTAIVMVAGQ